MKLSIKHVHITGFSVSRYVILNTDISWPGPQILMGSSKRGVISSLLDPSALRADIAVPWPHWSMINLRTRGLRLILPVVSLVSAITQRQYVRDIFYKGLMPGEMIHTGGRRRVNLT